VAQGHRSFGLLGISAQLHGRLGRMHGIIAALAAHRLPFAQCTRSLDHLHVRENDFEFGRDVAGSFATLADRPTAYLALNDEIAIGAMHGLQAAGLEVPRAAAVVGFNNQEICAMTRPTLTSVDQQIEATSRAGAEVLLGQIDQPPRTKPILRTIEPRLVIRQSSDPRLA
jgi:DNA-binding LacI/PurR family transcriptional regulator